MSNVSVQFADFEKRIQTISVDRLEFIDMMDVVIMAINTNCREEIIKRLHLSEARLQVLKVLTQRIVEVVVDEKVQV
jgi:hypothetical protein